MKKHVPANRTGADASPLAADMLELVDIAKPSNMTTATLAESRAHALAASSPIGSPPPAPGGERRFLLDLLGERCAFERVGVRLYDALIAKARARAPFPDAPTVEELERFRAEEHQHFLVLREAIRALGGDPTLLTPGADVGAVCATGVAQAIGDPRLDLGESLSAILVAELTDNDAWTSLIECARAAGEDELASSLGEAERQEGDHLAHVRAWLDAWRAWRLEGNGERGGPAGAVATAVTRARGARTAAKRALRTRTRARR